MCGRMQRRDSGEHLFRRMAGLPQLFQAASCVGACFQRDLVVGNLELSANSFDKSWHTHEPRVGRLGASSQREQNSATMAKGRRRGGVVGMLGEHILKHRT